MGRDTVRRWCVAGAVALATLAGTATTAAAAPAGPPAPLLGDAAGAATTAGKARYLVVRNKNAARRTHGRVLRTYSRVLDGYTAELTPDELTTVRRDPAVSYVQADAKMRVIEPLTAVKGGQGTAESWGLDRIDQRTKTLNGRYAYENDGNGVAVYVVDDGVRTTHTQFGGRAEAVYDAIGGTPDPAKCGMHGTHVAGTIAGATYGVAKGALIKSVRVIDCEGFSFPSWIVTALEWVAANAAPGSIVNMSIGSTEDVFRAAVDGLAGAGLVPVVAAGNDNNNLCTSAFTVERAITVGATTRDDRRAAFSNSGPCVDIWAPGEDILSSVPADDGASASYSGTSMATPHVAGWAARYRELHPAVTVAQIRTAVEAGATRNALDDIPADTVNLLLYAGPGQNAPDGSAPTAPGTPVASGVRYDSVRLSWGPATDDTRVAWYEIRTAAGPVAVTGVTATTVTGLTPATAYRFTVRARDAAGNWSPESPVLALTTAPADVTGPSTPGTPAASRVSANDIVLSWAASGTAREGSGITGYQVEQTVRGTFGPAGETAATTLALTGLRPETPYRFRVRARDGFGNWSAYSPEVTVRTLAPTPGCAVRYRPTPVSNGQFSVFPVVENTGTIGIAAGWTLTFTLPAGQTLVPPGMGATVTANGSDVTVTVDRVLSASSTFAFGFTVAGTANDKPTAYALNGRSCTIP